nr:MAG TPA: hypothetical protein [Caudoviricetes sp.]
MSYGLNYNNDNIVEACKILTTIKYPTANSWEYSYTLPEQYKNDKLYELFILPTLNNDPKTLFEYNVITPPLKYKFKLEEGRMIGVTVGWFTFGSAFSPKLESYLIHFGVTRYYK